MIVDNNILSALAKMERLNLLNQLFDEVSTTTSVIEEVHRDEVAGYDFVLRIDEIKRYNGGWLEVTSLSENEIESAEEIVDTSLSFTDAECIALSISRDQPLLTDDGHVGEMAKQRGVEVWDLKLLVEACIHTEIIKKEEELENLIKDLEKKDNYRFSERDRKDLRERF